MTPRTHTWSGPTGERMVRYGCAVLLAVSSVLLPLGVLVPTVRIQMTDPLSNWVGSGFAEYRAHSSELSIVGVIGELWGSSSRVLSVIILAFSIVFPVAKLSVLWAGAINTWLGVGTDRLRRALRLADRLGKWSLLDVLVIAVAVVTLKQFPGGVQVTLGMGVWLFGASVVLAMAGGLLLHRWYEQNAARPASR